MIRTGSAEGRRRLTMQSIWKAENKLPVGIRFRSRLGESTLAPGESSSLMLGRRGEQTEV
jgi:hypothetical protein